MTDADENDYPATEGDLSRSDVVVIRACLRELASVAERTVHTVTAVRDVPTGSPIYDLSVMELLGSQRLFTGAHTAVHLVVLSAASHIKSFVTVMSSTNTTTASATLARGVIEALSKAYYLLHTPDARTFLQRYVALQAYEFGAMKRSSFQDADGNLVQAEQHVKELEHILERAEIPLLHPRHDRVNVTTMVHTLLEASADLDPGLAGGLYSELSGIAHGNSNSIAMFQRPDSPAPRLRLPRGRVLEQAGMCLGSLVTVIDAYVALHEPPAAVSERWHDALARSNHALLQLQSTLEDINGPRPT